MNKVFGKTKLSVMVVDDNEVNIDILVDTLSDEYEIQVAMDGKSAIEDITAFPPDLILLDIMMPGMDGYEVCKRLKANTNTREIPIIFVTAMADVSDETKGFALGAVDYITKPISPPIVQSRVRNHLQLKQALADLAKQNELLQENTRLRDDVERIARHDLKTPLNALMAVPQMLANDDNLTPHQKEMLQMVEESSYRVMDIINSSIDLYKMEKKKYPLQPVPVDLIKVLRQLRGEIQNLMVAKRIGLQIKIFGNPATDSDTFFVLGEEMLFYSMFANLIKNALEASPEGKDVLVALDEKERESLILIHNKGAVPSEMRDCFFDKNATFGKDEGSGLGTYSSQLIVETMEGKISFKTNDEKDVTTLAIRLSKKYNSSKAEKRIAQNEDSLNLDNDISILVVDDYAMMRKIITGFLKDMGFFRIRRVDSAESALKVLEVEKVDLIISDYDMPGMNGVEFLKHVKADDFLRKIPFIMITGRAESEIVSKAGAYGVTNYIVKPFSADVLKNKLKSLNL